jgi:hypothetical protein
MVDDLLKVAQAMERKANGQRRRKQLQEAAESYEAARLRYADIVGQAAVDRCREKARNCHYPRGNPVIPQSTRVPRALHVGGLSLVTTGTRRATALTARSVSGEGMETTSSVASVVVIDTP